ncbi:glutathione transferase [Apiospora arundinis]
MASNPPKPILVWLTPPGPNPWKVIFLLEELGLNYEIKSFSSENVKKKPFTDVNPNGRVPAIEDPNTDLTLWESGAIYQYLVETYDGGAHHVSHGGAQGAPALQPVAALPDERSGPLLRPVRLVPAPAPEKYQPAIDRYANEIRRVLGMLEGVLAARPADAQWLVGGKMAFVDMAFVPWNFRLSEGFPHVRAWHERMVDLPSWKRSMEIRARLMDEQGLYWNGVPKGIETFKEYEEQIAAKDKEA